MRRKLAILCASLIGGAGLGWFTTPRPSAPQQAQARILPLLEHGGADAWEAYQRFSAIGFSAAAPALEAPPPPDVAVLFRRDLTAIEQRPNGRLVWIVDLTRDFGRRSLRVGDVYQDGWRVAAIGTQTIELRRRRERRRIDVFAPLSDGEQ